MITKDAMGTQREVAEKIGEKKGYYVLAVKRNQIKLYEGLRGYLREEGIYSRAVEKAHGRLGSRLIK